MRDLFDFIQKYYHWLLFIILEVASGILLFSYNSYQNSVWCTTANAVTGTVLECRSAITAFFEYKRNNELLTERNINLERQLANMRRAYESATGGEQLDTLALDSIGRCEMILAKVVGNSIDKPDNLITINKGKADGVDIDMGVICGRGVVGTVLKAGEHYSIVMPVLNQSSRISCSIRGCNYFGYLNWQGGDCTIAYLEDVPRHAKVAKGDWIETSGFSAIFPPGVIVGQVLAVGNSADGISYRLKVHLTTDFGCLRDVAVMKLKHHADSTDSTDL